MNLKYYLRRWHGPRDKLPPRGRWLYFYGYLREALTAAKVWAVRPSETRTRFLVVCQPRTGSQFLCSLLDSHPQILCEQELLGQPTWKPGSFLNNRSRLAPGLGYGSKVKPFQLRFVQQTEPREWFIQRLEEGWKLVHLQRRNLLRLTLSGLAATQHKRYHRFPGQESLRLKADVALLLRRLRSREERGEYERRSLEGLECFKLYYEDDLFHPAKRTAKLSELLRWLDMPDVPLSTDMLANTPPRLQDFLENYEEVVDSLRGTEFERYLEDTTL